MGFRPAFADLSHWNTIADSAWAQAKSAGLVGVILKATEGTSYVDNTFASRRKKAAAAGLLVSSYHFLKVSGASTSQMQHYVNTVKPVKGERMVIDFEEKGLNANDLIAAVQALYEYAPQCEISVYSGQSFINETCGGIGSNDILAKTSLWVARYTSAADPGTIPSIWPTWTAWQYTDGQAGGDPKSVAGFGKCDLNEFNGSAEACARWFVPSAAPPVPEPEPEPQPEPEVAEVRIETTGHVRVTVNGQIVTYE